MVVSASTLIIMNVVDSSSDVGFNPYSDPFFYTSPFLIIDLGT